ncbi:N/A [soil metagenome]
MANDLAGRTDVGCVRKENQDGVLAERFAAGTPQEVACVAVADGMGGHEKGRQASERALAVLRERMASGFTDLDETAASQILQDAHAKVSELAEPGQTVGTTMTLALVKGRDVLIVHVGDSRAYRLDGDLCEALTEDHTYGNLARKKGEGDPNDKTLYQAIGVDHFIKPDVVRAKFDDGESLLICSDGLYKMVVEAGIANLASRYPGAERACEELVKAANYNGGRDNVAVALMRFGRPPIDKRVVFLVALIVGLVILIAADQIFGGIG